MIADLVTFLNLKQRFINFKNRFLINSTKCFLTLYQTFDFVLDYRAGDGPYAVKSPYLGPPKPPVNKPIIADGVVRHRDQPRPPLRWPSPRPAAGLGRPPLPPSNDAERAKKKVSIYEEARGVRHRARQEVAREAERHADRVLQHAREQVARRAGLAPPAPSGLPARSVSCPPINPHAPRPVSVLRGKEANRYSRLRCVGEGAWGKVYLVREHKTRKEFVMKRMDVSRVPADEKKRAMNEVNILQSLRHPNIVEEKVQDRRQN